MLLIAAQVDCNRDLALSQVQELFINVVVHHSDIICLQNQSSFNPYCALLHEFHQPCV
jgi:hypothetical protein